MTSDGETSTNMENKRLWDNRDRTDLPLDLVLGTFDIKTFSCVPRNSFKMIVFSLICAAAYHREPKLDEFALRINRLILLLTSIRIPKCVQVLSISAL